MIPQQSAKQTAVRMFMSTKSYISDFDSQLACCFFAINEIKSHLTYDKEGYYLRCHKYWDSVKDELRKIELEISVL